MENIYFFNAEGAWGSLQARGQKREGGERYSAICEAFRKEFSLILCSACERQTERNWKVNNKLFFCPQNFAKSILVVEKMVKVNMERD